MRGSRWIMLGLASAAAWIIWATGVQAGSKPAAVVNGEPIPLAEVEAITKQLPASTAPQTETQRKQMQVEVLGKLIEDLLMRQFLTRNGPKVNPADLAKAMTSLEAGLKARHQTKDDFCHSTGQTQEQLRANLTQILQWAAYVKEHIKDDDLKRYYQENRDYFDQITVQASHIMIRVSPNAPPAEHDKARTKLEQIRRDIAAAKIDFAEAAKKYSQCESAAHGGDLGFFARKFALDENLARAAFALKVGAVSEVVQSDFGYHLIQVTNRRQEGPPSEFNKLKNEVREAAATDLYQAKLEEQRKSAKIEVFLGNEQAMKTAP